MAKSTLVVAIGGNSLIKDPAHMSVPDQYRTTAETCGKIAELLRLPEEKVPSNIDRIGNTGAASVIILMDEERQKGRLKDGDLCLLSAFGAGYLWGTAVLKF